MCKFIEHYLDRVVDGARRKRRDVGRGGWVLRRAETPRRPRVAAEGPIDGRPAILRRHRLRGETLKKYPRWFHACASSAARPELTAFIQNPSKRGEHGRLLASILNEEKLRRVLERMLDENEFLSPHGIRSLSRYHEKHPYVLNVKEQEYRVSYLPAESDSGMFGGNSNWRGPIWMPVNGLIVRALQLTRFAAQLHGGCPTGSGNRMTRRSRRGDHATVVQHLPRTRRAAAGTEARGPSDDPALARSPAVPTYLATAERSWREDQTGWTGIVARLMHLLPTTADQVLEIGKGAAVAKAADLLVTVKAGARHR